MRAAPLDEPLKCVTDMRKYEEKKGDTGVGYPLSSKTCPSASSGVMRKEIIDAS